MRYITLEKEDIIALSDCLRNSSNSTIRKRSQCLLLSHQGFTIKELSTILSVNRRSIERWYDGWAKTGTQSLSISSGRGVKTRLKGFENDISEQLELHSRNLKNVLLHLEKEHKISICKKTLQNFLKDTGL